MENLKTSITLRAADNIRVLSAAMVEKAKSGHPGGAMGGADFIHILFSEFMHFDPEDGAYPFRDRFFLDPGHMSAMLYSQLGLLGKFTMSELSDFRQWGSPTPGHPEIDIKRGIENTSGPLGLGHAFGVGAAIAERFLVERFGEQIAHKTYLYISDGGIQEEISQGVGRTAGFLGLGNVIMFYDANDVQLSTTVHDVMSEDTAKKYESWGWEVITIDGHNHDEIRSALTQANKNTTQPTLIIGRTIMGKGAVKADGSSHEGEVETHGKPLGKSKASYGKTITNLGGDVIAPFQVFPDVAAYYEAVKELKRKAVAKQKAEIAIWKNEHPALAAKLDQFLSGELPPIDWAAIEQKAGEATRNASAVVLEHLADKVENLIVASADLSNSDKTDGFLNKTTHFRKDDFSGSFLQAGVSELTMSALSTGMVLHGGVIAACATFFVFSDYMKPVLRVAALMEKPTIFIWTHDAFRVGEDGPTHQPIEQEAQLRLLEQLKNHSGNSSFLALRPADVNETTVAWKMALENKSTPTGLIFSRQNIANLPNSSYETALQAERGGYIVQDCESKPDVILVANGSEVSTLVGGAALLSKEGIQTRIVSVPSEGLFRTQPTDYQNEVLPNDVPKFGLTAGLPRTLSDLVGANGKVVGMTHFGYSAPYTVLDEKFGFTPENVCKEVKAFLNK
jgi:transketolase